ncbi:hypothetical protein MUK70_12860 [Dyadobacter chenwenxiniae]|uniref:Uncharacterized protein n=1 Tax=Dyadobacter chenwenxiniae TaxID=2906456 RepID=A0A9X1PF74_9BACT|nr:hypothetical protein [Dyadobacter chenwenxiniae]MCF0060135.1 hypothetical protein [Dyadobacter chenwenxiniae]UON85872.1 hypothetical protein MUK70_12860 [Dyadobacter chenwenxiniae]
MNSIINANPNQHLILEVVPLDRPSQECLSIEVAIKDGPNQQAFSSSYFRVVNASPREAKTTVIVGYQD